MTTINKTIKILASGRANTWERDFINGIQNLQTLSPKQQNLLNDMFRKYVLEYHPRSYYYPAGNTR